MSDSVIQIEWTLQSNNKNDKSQKRDDVLLSWSDALPQLSIGQPPDRRQKGKRCQTHTIYIDQRIILTYVQKLLDFGAMHFKFHDRINQRPINFQSAISKIAQGDNRFCASQRYVKFCPTSNKHPDRCKGLTSNRTHDQ
jgi:hypothetical protein